MPEQYPRQFKKADKFFSYLCLHHCRTLCAEVADGLEHVNNTLILHALQDLTQGDKDTGTSNASTERASKLSGKAGEF